MGCIQLHTMLTHKCLLLHVRTYGMQCSAQLASVLNGQTFIQRRAWREMLKDRVPCLQDCKDGDVVVQQGAGREHGRQVEEQVRVLLELVRQRALEGILKGGRRCRGNAVPALWRSPVVVVDCTLTLMKLRKCRSEQTRQYMRELWMALHLAIVILTSSWGHTW